MALEKMRSFVFAIAAVALFLATVLPSMDISVSMAGSAPALTMAAMDGMDCPDCNASRDKMAGCVQATCIGFAAMGGGAYSDDSSVRPAYAIAAVALPDGFISAPPTPPI